MTSLANLDPTPLWKHFDKLTQIPRPSKKEGAACKHLRDLAAERKLTCLQDGIGNIIIRVPGTKGLENAPSVAIQNHIDMVCEKDTDTNFNFDTDAIPTYVDGDWVRTKGTTLGADNGIGVAAALALVDDSTCQHGPLELLFTIDEETGLTGATNLDGSLIKSKIMLNLDSEEEGIFYIGCAGGAQCTISVPCRREMSPSKHITIATSIGGLRGGHSGLNIIDNRANAIKTLARCLRAASKDHNIRIVDLSGGSKHNAIPREAFATIMVETEHFKQVSALFEAEFRKTAREYGSAEPDMKFEWKEVAPTPGVKCVETSSARKVIDLLCGLPHGVATMNREMQGLVETSSNLAIITTKNDSFNIIASVRSSVGEAKDALLQQIEAVCTLANVGYTAEGAYPAWRPNPKSPLLARAQTLWEKLHGKASQATAIHAGLECGVILEKCPGTDVISFGPDIRGAHSPTECVNIPSVSRFYAFLKNFLGDLAATPL